MPNKANIYLDYRYNPVCLYLILASLIHTSKSDFYFQSPLSLIN